jgi:hypothetical protein
LKKVANSSSESISSRVQTEQELIAIYCDLNETYTSSNDTCTADKKHKIMMGEMRKLNIKLIKLDSFLTDLTKLVKMEMKALRDEIGSLKNVNEKK